MLFRFWLWLVLLTTVAACQQRRPEATSTHRLERGWLMIDSARSEPPVLEHPGWSPVQLPDDWRARRNESGGLGWYRFSVPLSNASATRWALYLPGVNLTADAYVNGQQVGSGGSLRTPVARNFARPLYFEFPGSLLRAGDNRIDVVLSVVPHAIGWLTPASLGPVAELRPGYERDHFLRNTLPWLETFLALVTAALMVVFWRSSSDRVFGSFSLVSAFYAVISLNYRVAEPPLSFWAWERLALRHEKVGPDLMPVTSCPRATRCRRLRRPTEASAARPAIIHTPA